MSFRLLVLVGVTAPLSSAQPGPSPQTCNQVDGDYPGCGLSKLTHSSSDPQTGKQFLYKYFPVQTPGDECDNDVCECSASSKHPAAWKITQGRVYTTREISPSGGDAPPPGNGFGLHLVDVPAHLTTGGNTTEEVEAQFAKKLGDMTKFDSFMDFNAVFATSGLQAYKDVFKQDGVKYLAGTWADVKDQQYTSVIVQVPGSQLILELVQKTSLTYDEDEMQPVKLEQRVPDSVLVAQETRLSGGEDASSGSYIVSLVVNRAVSEKALGELEDFYVTGMGTTKTHDSSANGVSKKCFLWPGASGNLCFTNRPDSATTGDWKVGDFEDMLNTVHATLLKGHPFCTMDKWFDNHYAIDSSTVDTSKLVSYVDEKNPYHICASGGWTSSASLAIVFDPTGLGIQLDLMPGANSGATPRDCTSLGTDINSMVPTPFRSQGTYNPACDEVDTSKCGGSPGPSPGPAPGPSPPSPPPSPTPGAHCGQCEGLIGGTCPPDPVSCAACAKNHELRWKWIGCDPKNCPSEVQKACAGPEELMV